MPTPVAIRTRFAASALVLLFLVGCGGGAKTVPVNGKLVLPAKVKLEDTDSISVSFVPEDAANGKSGIASLNAKDLAFTVNLQPGKYKVAVAITPYSGTKNADARAAVLNKELGMFNPNSTSLRYEVTSDPGQSITVDLAKSAVSK